jgi:hypothetical protein
MDNARAMLLGATQIISEPEFDIIPESLNSHSEFLLRLVIVNREISKK